MNKRYAVVFTYRDGGDGKMLPDSAIGQNRYPESIIIRPTGWGRISKAEPAIRYAEALLYAEALNELTEHIPFLLMMELER